MRRLAAIAIIAVGMSGCLPTDDRPEPGIVLVNVQRSNPAADGFLTDDGWDVSFDRFVTALGDGALEGDDCADYSYSKYDRLYDFTVAGTSKVVLHYGLGHCDIVFSMRSPSSGAILMAGATAADRELMSTEDSDHSGKEEPPVGLMLTGRAEREGVTKEFSWLIRRSHGIIKCFAPASDEVVSTLDLSAGDEFVRDLVVRPQELFRVTPSLEAPIEFGRFAAADADKDGAITLEELAKVEVPVDEIVEELVDELRDRQREDIEGLVGKATLATLVHDILSWRVVAFAGAGECQVKSWSSSWF